MSRTYRKNPPQKVCESTTQLKRGDGIVESPAVPTVTCDGNVVVSTRKEKAWARHETIVKHRAQCKQALHHDREFPSFPATSGWVTW